MKYGGIYDMILLFYKNGFFDLRMFLDVVANSPKIVCAQLHDNVGIFGTAKNFKALDKVLVFYFHENVNLLEEKLFEFGGRN
jgi:hypothetical protein